MKEQLYSTTYLTSLAFGHWHCWLLCLQHQAPLQAPSWTWYWHRWWWWWHRCWWWWWQQQRWQRIVEQPAGPGLAPNWGWPGTSPCHGMTPGCSLYWSWSAHSDSGMWKTPRFPNNNASPLPSTQTPLNTINNASAQQSTMCCHSLCQPPPPPPPPRYVCLFGFFVCF